VLANAGARGYQVRPAMQPTLGPQRAASAACAHAMQAVSWASVLHALCRLLCPCYSAVAGCGTRQAAAAELHACDRHGKVLWP
jgi:hypothetical protein